MLSRATVVRNIAQGRERCVSRDGMLRVSQAKVVMCKDACRATVVVAGRCTKTYAMRVARRYRGRRCAKRDAVQNRQHTYDEICGR